MTSPFIFIAEKIGMRRLLAASGEHSMRKFRGQAQATSL
jgi:hypothetical protein